MVISQLTASMKPPKEEGASISLGRLSELRAENGVQMALFQEASKKKVLVSVPLLGVAS